MARSHYLSCYGPQFPHGLAILAAQSKYRPAVFLKAALRFPNHFELMKKPASRNFRAGDVKTVAWSVIAAIGLVIGLLFFYFQIPLTLLAMYVVLLVVVFPFLMIAITAAVLWLHATFPR